MTGKTIKSSAKQKIGNKDKGANCSLRCINCGCKEEINLVAHRNNDNYITGFVAVCSDCVKSLEKCKKNIQMVTE